jgi:Ulp1 family protease
MITYFYSKLESEGVESVIHWTTKNNINILSKKLVFILIHKDHHWSLMVIVNACLVDHFDDCDTVSEVPCMLHLDGLSLHNRKEIADNLRLWLNAEWKKNKTSSVNVFTTLTMDSFSLSGEHNFLIK